MEQYQQVSDNISWVGVKHPELEIFDELFPTHNGTTYNSYVIKGKEKTALIDTVKAPFTEEFFEKIEDAIGLENIDLVVISHTEPDHSGALGALLGDTDFLVVREALAARIEVQLEPRLDLLIHFRQDRPQLVEGLAVVDVRGRLHHLDDRGENAFGHGLSLMLVASQWHPS